mmetsp:Transcript_29896/g.88862  ORF Transcript_29896/g.88862 Transcript_29896/m.88862 type:complete len:221 (-) Transcript_29896:197-859(-)
MSSAESALLPVKVHDGTSSSASSSSPRQIAAEERRDRSDSLLSLGDDAPPPPHHHREGEGEGMGEDEDEDEEPGKMRVSELKAELDLRGVDYSGCFDKESLAAKLLQARATGKANPDIIDDFNKMRLDETIAGEETSISDEDIQQMVGGDGTLPGGLPPDMLKKLMSNPELTSLLQSPKMQEAMRLMMTGGQSALEKAMQEDHEVYEVVTKLNKVMEGTQ